MIRKRSMGVAMVAMLALAVLGAAACDNGDDNATSSDADVLSSIQILDKAGLHDIDVSINEQKTVPATAQTTARHMEALVRLTDWPNDDLQEQANALATTFGQLAAAVDKGDQSDMTAAGAAAKKAHDDQHAFSHAVWDYLQEKAGVSTGGGDSHQ